MLANLSSSRPVDFADLLDGQDNASAQLDLPLLPGATGPSMQFACLTSDPFDIMSNAVQVTITPWAARGPRAIRAIRS